MTERQQRMNDLMTYEPCFGYVHEPFFSKRPCECCGNSLAGLRIDVKGQHDTYAVCTDCLHFLTYGILPEGEE